MGIVQRNRGGNRAATRADGNRWSLKIGSVQQHRGQSLNDAGGRGGGRLPRRPTEGEEGESKDGTPSYGQRSNEARAHEHLCKFCGARAEETLSAGGSRVKAAIGVCAAP